RPPRAPGTPLGRTRTSLAFEPSAGANAPHNLATHEKIIDAALADLFTEDAQYDIFRGTLDQDYFLTQQGMSENATAAHSMSPPAFWRFLPFTGHPSPQRSLQLRDKKN